MGGIQGILKDFKDCSQNRWEFYRESVNYTSKKKFGQNFTGFVAQFWQKRRCNPTHDLSLVVKQRFAFDSG